MRKNVIALMLVLPLLFVFAVFTSGNAASLGVSVSVSGIEILNAPEGGLNIDLAEYDGDFKVEAQVLPENASDKGYSFRVEEAEGSAPADISVADDGTVTANGAGSARIVVESNDGGYTDSMLVVVSSSKPYGMNISLYSAAGGEDLLEESGGDYRAEISTGRYDYSVRLLPTGFDEPETEVEEGFAEIAGGSLLVPFGGRTVVKFTVRGGAFGDIVRRVVIDAERPQTVSGITVNGEAEASLAVEEGSLSASFYIQSDERPEIEHNANISGAQITSVRDAGAGCYLAEVTFAENHSSGFVATIAAGGGKAEVSFTFGAFAFTVNSTLPVQGGDVSMLTDSPVTFYAVPSVSAEGVSFEWRTGGDIAGYVELQASGSSCRVSAGRKGTFTLTATPVRGGFALDVQPVTIEITVIDEVTSVGIQNGAGTGLAGDFTVAGRRYKNGRLAANSFALGVAVYNGTQRLYTLSDMEIVVSDPSLARVDEADGDLVLTPLGTGEVTVGISWAGNQSFGRNVAASLTVNAVADGVLCNTSGEVFAAADSSLPIVLGADVMLGEDIKGDESALRARLGTMKTTYNSEFYKNTDNAQNAVVNYVIEFSNDVYGNGHFINAEYFTNLQDGTGRPLLFRGPLDFVSFGEMAAVAAQDNISYLVRTDGVTLYNVSLLGCSDSSLEEDGQYKLEKLNNTGTVLEINADCDVINCRVRNGRTVVRAYGGNRDGNGYFIESLSQNTGCEGERADIRIEGCILSQGREFLLKTGANRALRANSANGAEPYLTAADGTPYASQTNDYLSDEYFYRMYVLTNVTLKDSVLETSGLFSVGVECNFSGAVLAQNSGESGVNFEGWAGAGGTSFASVLRIAGDVRMYDWKDISLIDSSTLIEVAPGADAAQRFRLDIGGMLDFATAYDPERYGSVLAEYQGQKVVHGGIAAYGGGRNYAQIDLGGMEASRSDLSRYMVNISILQQSDDEVMKDQGTFLPLAAGNQDFRFYMYGAGSKNSYAAQLADAASGVKYAGISRPGAFRM